MFGKNWVIESGIQLKSYHDIRTSIDYISLSVLLGWSHSFAEQILNRDEPGGDSRYILKHDWYIWILILPNKLIYQTRNFGFGFFSCDFLIWVEMVGYTKLCFGWRRVNDVYNTPLPGVSPVKKTIFLHLYREVNTARGIFLENFLGENETPN